MTFFPHPKAPANNAAFDGYGYEEVVQFEEGVPKALGCTVMGGSPAPGKLVMIEGTLSNCTHACTMMVTNK